MMKSIEKQLADLQRQIEHLTTQVTVLLAHSPGNAGGSDRTLVRKHQPKLIQDDRTFNPAKGLNRFRALQSNG
ncbi:hypothetical protein GCM10028803_28720 [Larkinella knui]|uniref:Uncharacterized protein n=1 Tax=Larkinella knui TaxID=2025310 RepID=A0A3P1CXL3_9BACT|nr:hypothetical protein [Larkinella knui]RRB17908.1 hypothetical protein EHT87_06435 [Larkinella knui]